jgi:hypothetical protein
MYSSGGRYCENKKMPFFVEVCVFEKAIESKWVFALFLLAWQKIKQNICT